VSLGRVSPATFFLVLLIYLLYTGSFTPFDVVTGCAVAAIVSLIVGRWLVRNDLKVVQVRRWAAFLSYSLRYFLVDEVRTHVDVAKRVFTLRSRPGIVRVPLDVRSEYGRVFVANSITNTPGTVVVDISDDGRWLYVHWIDVGDDLDEERIRKEVLSHFEEHARRIFD